MNDACKQRGNVVRGNNDGDGGWLASCRRVRAAVIWSYNLDAVGSADADVDADAQEY